MQKGRFEYKWVILAVAFTMVFVCLGFCSSNKGLYLTAITEALDIKRSLFSINDSMRFTATAVCNLFFGSLLHRFGARKLVAFGFLSLIGSMLLYVVAEHVLVFYVGGLLLGIGMTFTTNTMASYIVKRWFDKNVGTYLGLVFAANGIGGALAAQIITPIIYEEGNAFGYRNAYLLVALILLCVGTLSVILLRESPEGYGRHMMGQKSKKKGRSWSGIHYSTAKRMPAFFLMAAIVFFTGFMLQAITGVWTAHLKDTGIDIEFVATVASVSSLAITASKFMNGMLYDRFGIRIVVTACHMATVFSFLTILFVSPSTLGIVLSFVFAIAFAFALPLETIIIPLLVNEIFGDASYDKILGIMMAMNYTGYAIGTPVVNLCYDITGSYNLVFIIFMFLMLACSIAFNLILTSVNKKKEVILNEGNTEA